MSNHLSQPQSGPSTPQHVQRSFWLLVTVAVLATGSLSSALVAPPSPLIGLRVAISGLVLLFSLTLATRVMIALARVHRRDTRT
jgi:hypothetical protein